MTRSRAEPAPVVVAEKAPVAKVVRARARWWALAVLAVICALGALAWRGAASGSDAEASDAGTEDASPAR